VTATKISVSTLSAISANMGTLTAGEIRVGSGTVGVNFTGFRVMSTYLGGYNSDVFQAGIRVSDGVFVAAAGSVWIDSGGVNIAQSTSSLSAVKWFDSTDLVGRAIANWGGTASDPVYAILEAYNSNVSGDHAVAMLRAVDTGVDVRLNVDSNRTVSATGVEEFILNKGSLNWVDLSEGGDYKFVVASGNQFQVNHTTGTVLFRFTDGGLLYVYGGLYVGASTGSVGDNDIVCDGTISTEEGDEWNLGGVNSGTITPDSKIAVEINGTWYTLAAEEGLV